MAVSVLWLIHKVSLVGLQCVIVVFPDHAYLLFCNDKKYHMLNIRNYSRYIQSGNL